MRRIQWLLGAGAALSLVGCKTVEKTPKEKMADAMASAQKPGLWERMTGQRSQPVGDPNQSVSAFASTPVSKLGTPVKIETEVQFAETTFEGAMDPSVVGPDRDRRLDQARQQYARILERDPKNSKAMLGLARVYTETGDKEKAAQFMQKYFELNPKDHKSAYDFAVTYGRKKDYLAAVAGCEFALTIDPENREYRKSLGYYLALAGQVDQAITVLSSNNTMSEADARYNVAGLLNSMGQTDLAKQQLRQVLAISPQHESAQFKLNEMDGVVMPAMYQQAQPR